MDKRKPVKTSNPRNVQLLLSLPFSLLAFGLAIALLLVGFEIAYADRVYPGVFVDDVDLSGLSYEEIDQHLAEAMSFTYEGEIQFVYQDQTWTARPADLGYRLDPEASARQAFNIGRRSWLPANAIEKGRAWFTGVQLSPVAVYDERMALNFLQTIAAEIDQPVIEAALSLEGTDVIVVDSQIGLTVDIDTTLALLTPPLTHMADAEIPVVVNETSPDIRDVSVQAERLEQILSEPLVLFAPEQGEQERRTWTIQPEEMVSLLTIQRMGADSEEPGYQISINEMAMKSYLSSLASGLKIHPVNARFLFNREAGEIELLEPPVIGRNLDINSSTAYIDERMVSGAHEIELQFETINPPVTGDMSGEELGITELVHEYTSYFHGSGPARVQNIRISSSRFHGLLVAPGETFSMAANLGNISLDSGYAEAPIIFGGQTIQGVGGGVCQVSTTLFRAAFFGGFPIVERHAHSYRVSYYEQRSNGTRNPNLAGLDAAVYVPVVDFKFTNDTDHWLLMETYATNTSLTWRFYSTGDGRRVEWTTTGPTNIVKAPEPLYIENADLPTGRIEQVDYAADGADVRVNRTVYRGEQVHFSDSFFTHFQAWQAVFEYGPGTDIPETNSD